MDKLVWHNIGRFVGLLLFQVLVLNNVYLGSYIMPMLYVLPILMLPTGMKRIPLLLIAFGTGLIIDMMNNLLGFHALACTVVAMMRIWFADRIDTRRAGAGADSGDLQRYAAVFHCLPDADAGRILPAAVHRRAVGLPRVWRHTAGHTVEYRGDNAAGSAVSTSVP